MHQGLKKSNMVYYTDMATVTVPKTKYEELKKQAAAYRKIVSAAGADLFKPPTRDAQRVVAALKGTGRYSKKFIASVARGLTRSSYFAKR